jgi:hypothetical protein
MGTCTGNIYTHISRVGPWTTKRTIMIAMSTIRSSPLPLHDLPKALTAPLVLHKPQLIRVSYQAYSHSTRM